MASQTYVLPCHFSCKVEDRFSVCEEYADQLEIPQWTLIRTLLQRPVIDVTSLEELLSIIQYDLQFSTLRSTLQSFSGRGHEFFASVWPRMVISALNLPQLFPDGLLQALPQLATSSVCLSREQIASLLVHMFLCSMRPPVWSQFWANFGIWYNSESPPVSAYLLCLLDYFSQLDSSGKPPNPLEEVRFYRHPLAQPPDWSSSSSKFYAGIFVSSTSLEPEPSCNVEVSFANKDVGFGVSGTQEEVKMGMSPEACVAMLIAPTLLENETLLIRGARQVGRCKGIGRNVVYDGPMELVGTRDWNVRWIIAMDAMELDVMECNDSSHPVSGNVMIHELRESVLKRELNKAYCGFSGLEVVEGHGDNTGVTDERISIATGHWGCGSFCGNKHAKALIQLMAAVEAKKTLVYHDVESGLEEEDASPFLTELKSFVNVLVRNKVTVGQLYSVMLEAGRTQFSDAEQTLFTICTKIMLS